MASLALAFCGCGKKTDSAQTPNSGAAVTADTAAANATPPVTVPGTISTPATPVRIADTSSIDAILADLTRELHKTMIGRRLSGSFEEFVAIRNLKVPPPPAGKKYAISKQWRVVLVDAK